MSLVSQEVGQFEEQLVLVGDLRLEDDEAFGDLGARHGEALYSIGMSHDWADLGTAADRAGRDRFLREVAAGWRRALEQAEAPGKIRFADGVWVERHASTWVVRWAEPSLRPLARSVLEGAPAGQPVLFGLPGSGWAVATDLARRVHGVDLDACEVRVGITRGHLLALVFSIPLDVPGDGDALQAAVECLSEQTLGEQILDQWVLTIDVTRAARRSKLAVLPAGGRAAAETHPLHLLEELVRLGIMAITAELPESQLSLGSDDWTALDIDPDRLVFRAIACRHSPTVPKRLKAAIEGLPFDSARFTRGPEVMVWFAWTLSSLATRLAAREVAEAVIGEIRRAEGACALCGSGFGPTKDYLDVWVIPEVHVLSLIRTQLAARIGTSIELGFYDSQWAKERLVPAIVT